MTVRSLFRRCVCRLRLGALVVRERGVHSPSIRARQTGDKAGIGLLRVPSVCAMHGDTFLLFVGAAVRPFHRGNVLPVR
jgi:hypothetical protein